MHFPAALLEPHPCLGLQRIPDLIEIRTAFFDVLPEFPDLGADLTDDGVGSPQDLSGEAACGAEEPFCLSPEFFVIPPVVLRRKGRADADEYRGEDDESLSGTKFKILLHINTEISSIYYRIKCRKIQKKAKNHIFYNPRNVCHLVCPSAL